MASDTTTKQSHTRKLFRLPRKRIWNQLKALAVEMVLAQTRGDKPRVDAIHRQMHALDPKGQYFHCDNCPAEAKA